MAMALVMNFPPMTCAPFDCTRLIGSSAVTVDVNYCHAIIDKRRLRRLRFGSILSYYSMRVERSHQLLARGAYLKATPKRH